MGLDYKLPDLSSPLFIIREVAEHEGQIIAAGVVRLEAELYVWVDREVGTPKDRWEAVKQLNETAMSKAYWEKGLDNAVLWCPPEIEKSFGKRLKALGFTPDRGWRSWSRPTRL